MVGFAALEALVYNGSMQIFGDPIFAGLLTAIFFGGFVFVQGQKLDGKLLGIGAGLILASAFIPGFIILVGLGFAFVLYKGLMKLIGKG